MLYSTCGLLVHKTQKSTYVQKLRTVRICGFWELQQKST